VARVLGRVRLSRSTEESTTETRQREAVETWAVAHGHEVIGWAVDLDVSGSVSPFKAPELGSWLRPERMPEWDILAAYRLDRIARRVIPLNALFGLCLDNNKTVVSTSENIDLSNWVGRLVTNVIARFELAYQGKQERSFPDGWGRPCTESLSGVSLVVRDEPLTLYRRPVHRGEPVGAESTWMRCKPPIDDPDF
jgi:hypothetical protein